uniref:Formate dehydrogenase cytochrome b subunit n=1 Tax=Acetithermum autotrophicum TaxID=1446466 RepID=H5STW7_ACEAU|nr:formate dehydrogenase cytochrome b subunit [Candidatus Acetothermum autotrophicum]
MTWQRVLALSIVLALGNTLAWAQPPNSECLLCHATQGMSITLPSQEELSLYVDEKALAQSVHAQLACVQCHSNITGYPHPPVLAHDRRDFSLRYYPSCRQCHEDQYKETLDSIHLRVLAAGHREAPVCTDCHGAHTVRPPDQPRFAIDLTCSRCHQEIFAVYKQSVHGADLVKEEDNPDVPVCTDCHGVHRIEAPHTLQFRLHSPQLCAHCHADPARMSKYGLSTAVLRTYVSDFHGTTVQLFKERPGARLNEAVCTDCHGIHDIKRTDDPESRVIKENLLRTCQQCHPTATANFPTAWVKHYIPSPTEFPWVYYVELFYKIVIPLTIGFFLVFIALDVIRHIVSWIWVHQRKLIKAERFYERFHWTQLAEHWVMAIAFVMLALTGLPQKFSDTQWARAIADFFGGVENLRQIHHIFAIVTVLASIGHIVGVGYRLVVLRTPLFMMPRLKDLRDLLRDIGYNIGVVKSRARCDRYTYAEKLEYWALIWGTAIMVVTGFILWNPIWFTSFLPGQIVPAAKAAHGWEAVLAVLAILTWHVYHVHLKHFNTSIFTGKISQAELEHEHPLEWERLQKGEISRPSPEVIGRRQRVFLPIASLMAALMLTGVYYMITVEQTAIETVTPRLATPIPHSLELRGDCLACHSLNAFRPFPPDHTGRGNESCLTCHQR